MIKEITKEILWKEGVHFGHKTRNWNPKMKQYIYTKKNKIHILNLEETILAFEKLKLFCQKLAVNKGKVLFVGTKKTAKDVVKEAAERIDNFYINNRWLGGTLTNFKTIQKNIKKIWDIEAKEQSGYYNNLLKKEYLQIKKEKEKLLKNLQGIKNMHSLPDVLFVVDPKKEEVAIKEAHDLKIPIIAVCDSNANPDYVDYVIPGNDDNISSVSFLVHHFAEIYAHYFEIEIPEVKEIVKVKKTSKLVIHFNLNSSGDSDRIYDYHHRTYYEIEKINNNNKEDKTKDDKNS